MKVVARNTNVNMKVREDASLYGALGLGLERVRVRVRVGGNASLYGALAKPLHIPADTHFTRTQPKHEGRGCLRASRQHGGIGWG